MVLMTGCSKSGKFTADNFTVTPTPLEYIGGEVPATISVNFPEKFLNKKTVVTCTPVLKWDGGQSVGTGATFQGEKVEANNQIISYSNGGRATMRSTFPFQSGMESSDLVMTFNARKGNKVVKMDDVKIGYGTLCTAALVSKTAKTANAGIAADDFQRVINKKQAATIKFLIAQANLRGSELNSQNVKDFIATLKDIKSDEESLVLNNVEVSAYASPDGKYDFNKELAEKREDASTGFVKQQLKKAKLTTNVDSKYTAEDWEGFKELVSQSNLQDKELILSVLSMYSDPEQREQEIKNVSAVYSDLADAILPELRRARMTINYDVIGRSDEEIVNTFASSPEKLNAEELMYAGNILADNDADKAKYYNQIIKQYPNDARPYNNLAEIAMRNGDTEAAEKYLRQALSINPKSAEANANLGLLSLQDGDLQNAELYMSKGSASKNIDEALGNLYIAQGKYNQAASKLQNTSSNSAALAQILTQDYAKAKTTIANIKNPDATTYYLASVLAARMDNSDAITSNLKKAVSMDSTYAKTAANDVEFNKYADTVKAALK